ncbi:MAG: exosortase/archaeosortase family protein [Chloroflexi bacterium]|nr:exosortase/archaeosortase family protein [Chloroflexota bacterium]
MKRLRITLVSASLNLGLSTRLELWLIFSLVLSVIFLAEFWRNLPAMLSPGRVFGQYQASPWGVLALCFIVLWLKRQQVWSNMLRGPNLIFMPPGLALVAGALLMPSSPDYLTFQVLLVFLGVFVIFFGRGARLPSLLFAIYGFAISFPLAVQRFAGDVWSRASITPLTGLLTSLGFTLENEGQWVHFTSFSGEPISVAITAACAGPAGIGVITALFALMMLDMPLPVRKAAGLLLFGLVGTWSQNFIRLVILMLAGYYLGEPALWTAHRWTIYLLFPPWYLLFAYIYFRQSRRLPPATKVTAIVARGVRVNE